MDIELVRADITSIKVDAIVNPTNPMLAGAVPGTATVSSGGNLLCKFVIHAVSPRAGDADADDQLRSATLASLRRAEELAVASVAFPAMATGVFGLPLERSARVMLAATIDFRPHARSLRRVVYCLFGLQAHEEFARVLHDLEG
jgi:O-acetyl-ADP-ribose deacetylase (regulator of RNase III)